MNPLLQGASGDLNPAIFEFSGKDQPVHRLLKARQLISDPVRQLRDICLRFALDDRHRTLTKLDIIEGNHIHLADLRMSADHSLQFLGLDPFSAAEKQVIHATKDRQASVNNLTAIAVANQPCALATVTS